MKNRGVDGTSGTEPELGELWAKILVKAERELGKTCVTQWLRPVKMTGIDDDVATLAAGTSFLADWVERNYGLHLLRYLQ
ncbi:MAG: DnaA N-terminal domain-containing protein, partial [Xanthomonadales bacterium]|nr:DnaA N-terminal domain-containing protein [Xanthomonadales bacterium]